MKIFMFPGQGAQARGMGGSLFDEFGELTQQADDILGYSIRELCLQDPRRELGKTQFTQPALYVVNALSYYKKMQESAQPPDYLLGHSLGEFNALLAAECFDFETGLRLVQKRGELMSQVSNGAMAAILNATSQEIETILRDNGLSNVDLANYNSPSQIVISGPIEEIGRAQQFFQSGKMLYYPLNTSGAFHSRAMSDAREQFLAFMNGFDFAEPKIPVLANVTARPYEHGRIIETLSSQISSTVRWCESVQYLMEEAASRQDAIQFEEVGHGDVLTKIVVTIKQQTPAAPARSAAPSPEPPPAPIPARKLTAAERVAAWNGKYPVGTKVKSLTRDYDDLETRTAAVVLFGHRAAIYVKGYNGYFDMDEVAPL
jgi:malonyl CoA-acyl carrier protein transacylase